MFLNFIEFELTSGK